MADQIESHEASGVGSVSRQNASVVRSHKGTTAASKASSCGVISAKPSSHKPSIFNFEFLLLDPSRSALVAKSSRLFASCKSCSHSQSMYFSESSARSCSLSTWEERRVGK